MELQVTWKRDAARSSMQAPAWQKLSTGLHNIGGNILHINIFCKITDKKASKLVVFRAFISINIKKKRITVVICRISFCNACGACSYSWALTIDCLQMLDADFQISNLRISFFEIQNSKKPIEIFFIKPV